MRLSVLSIYLILVHILFCSAQKAKKICECIESKEAGIIKRQADTSFQFSNKKTIIVCGFKVQESEPAIFSEFTLTVCEQKKTIGFWGAKLNCQFQFKEDTLLIEDIRNLPTGEGRKYQNTIWTIEKIYFSKGEVQRQISTNRNLRKYSEREIQQTISEYDTSKYGLDENKMELANRLFISSISGSKKAKEYFDEFKNKFGTLDGAFAEEYSDLVAMLQFWNWKEIEEILKGLPY